MGEEILHLKMLDLLDQLLLGVLDVNLVDTLAVLDTRCASFARRSAVTLREIRQGKTNYLLKWSSGVQGPPWNANSKTPYLCTSFLAVETRIASYGFGSLPLFWSFRVSTKTLS